jgi:hypothetical protein
MTVNKPRFPVRVLRQQPDVAISALLVGAALAATACGDRAQQLPPLPREAADLPAFHNEASEWGLLNSWSVDSQPYLQIGVSDGPPHLAFTGISDVAETADGRIVISEQRQYAVHVFAADGAHVRSWTRGDGPGEFANSPTASVVRGDSLLVVVGRVSMPQLNRFTIAEGFIDRRAVVLDDITSLAPLDSGITSLRPLSGGGFLLTALQPSSAPAADGVFSGRDTSRYLWSIDNLGTARSLGTWPGRSNFEYRGRSASGSVRLGFEPPMSQRSAYATDPRGQRLCIGDGAWPRVACFDRDAGGLVFSWIVESSAVGDSARQAALAGFRSRVSEQIVRVTGMSGAESMQLLNKLDVSSQRAAFSTIHVDADLNVWVDVSGRRDALGDSVPPYRGVYTVFSPDGQLLGDVVMPRQIFAIHQIANDHLIATRMDGQGVPSVLLFRIRKN